MHGYNFKLGQENRMTGGGMKKQDYQQLTYQGEQVCLADYCDIIPCTFNAVAGSPKTKQRNQMINDLNDSEKVRLKNNTFRHRYNP